MPLEGLDRRLAVERPQPDGPISAAGDDARAVGRKGHAPEPAVMPLERLGRQLAVERP
jgi:hypothetical protein